MISQDARIAIRIPIDLKKKLEKEAKLHNIKLSRLIRNKLIEDRPSVPYLTILEGELEHKLLLNKIKDLRITYK